MDGATKTCPFCNYERAESDDAPKWECPSCKRAYNKFKPLAEDSGKRPTMTRRALELRPAWRNQWLLIAVIPLLLLSAIGLSFADPATSANGPEGPPTLFFIWDILVVAIVILIYRRYSWKFTIDNVRVSSHHGIIARNQKAVRIKDMRTVELQQGVIQRLLNVGGLAFYSAGSASSDVLFRGIKNPEIVRDDVQRLLDEMSGDR